jgi:hypothetical protein
MGQNKAMTASVEPCRRKLKEAGATPESTWSILNLLSVDQASTMCICKMPLREQAKGHQTAPRDMSRVNL